MAKKKTGLTQTLFRDINPYGGAEGEVADGEQRLSLAALRPDPQQPRRLLPGDLAEAVAGGTLDPTEAMRRWLERAGKTPSEPLRSLRQLADSIARHGLINAVSVQRLVEPLPGIQAGDVAFLLVTGERRYWAHVLLLVEGRQISEGDTRRPANTIRAHEVAPGVSIRAHQLIENLLREDINAVEKARGFWALRAELSGVNYSSPQEPNPRDLVPWTAVADTLGISKRYRIFVTNVLNLAPDAQALVEENNLPEVTIRPIVQKLKGRPALQLEALRRLVAWRGDETHEGSITRAVEQLVTRLLAREQRDARHALAGALPPASADVTRRFRRELRGTLRYLQQLDADTRLLVARDLALDAEYREAVADLRALRQQVDDLLTSVAAFPAEGS